MVEDQKWEGCGTETGEKGVLGMSAGHCKQDCSMRVADHSEGGVKDDLGFQLEPQRGQRGLIKDRGSRGPRLR